MTGLLATNPPWARSRSPRKTKPTREALAIEIELIAPEDLESVAARLGEILLAQVGKGSSVNFVHPFRDEEAAELFRKVAVGRGPGRALLWVARARAQDAAGQNGTQDGEGEGRGEEKGEEKGSEKGEIIGTVQLGFHISPNGRHRADVRKLLVHPDYERRGVARRLMEVLEEEARAAKTKLLLLDTEAHSPAQALYESLGWTVSGYVPRYASTPDGKEQRDAAFMYKELRCGNCDECECGTEKVLEW